MELFYLFDQGERIFNKIQGHVEDYLTPKHIATYILALAMSVGGGAYLNRPQLDSRIKSDVLECYDSDNSGKIDSGSEVFGFFEDLGIPNAYDRETSLNLNSIYQRSAERALNICDLEKRGFNPLNW